MGNINKIVSHHDDETKFISIPTDHHVAIGETLWPDTVITEPHIDHVSIGEILWPDTVVTEPHIDHVSIGEILCSNPSTFPQTVNRRHQFVGRNLILQ